MEIPFAELAGRKPLNKIMTVHIFAVKLQNQIILISTTMQSYEWSNPRVPLKFMLHRIRFTMHARIGTSESLVLVLYSLAET